MFDYLIIFYFMIDHVYSDEGPQSSLCLAYESIWLYWPQSECWSTRSRARSESPQSETKAGDRQPAFGAAVPRPTQVGTGAGAGTDARSLAAPSVGTKAGDGRSALGPLRYPCYRGIVTEAGVEANARSLGTP